MVEYAWTVVETDFIEQLMWRMVGDKLQKLTASDGSSDHCNHELLNLLTV